jgi:hypothetical protein
MYENRVLRTFEPRSAEMTGGSRKLYNCEENIIGIIKINCDEMNRACSMLGSEVFTEAG